MEQPRRVQEPLGGSRRTGRWRTVLFGGAAAGMAAGNLLLHKPISDLCDAVSARLGFATYNRLALAAIAGVSAAVLLAAGRRALRRGQPAATTTLAASAILLPATAAAQHWLLVANVELIHLPQYALLTLALGLAGAPAAPAWALGTAAGILDELYQYAVVYAGRSDVYLDFNDMLLNAIGAAWGVFLLRALAPRAEPRCPRTVLATPPLLLPAALWVDPPRLDPFLTVARTGRPYRVLSAPEAVVGCWILLVALLLLCRGRTGAKGEEPGP